MYNDDEKKEKGLENSFASSENTNVANTEVPNTDSSIGTQPDPTGAQPGATGTQSGVIGTQSGVIGTQPGATGTQPGATGTQPGATGTQSGAIGTQPGPTGTQSGTTGTQPGTTGQQTGLYGSQSGVSGQHANKEVKPHTYYEPWQQPAYRTGSGYSPGINAGRQSAYQRSGPTPPPPPVKKKKSSAGGFLKAVCLVLVCVLASAGATYGVLQYDKYYEDDQSINQVVLGAEPADESVAEATETPANSPAATGLTSSGQEMAAEDIYTMAVNQVVGVNSETETNVFGQMTTQAVSGSGFIISEDGYIVTNYHVIEYAVDYGYNLTVMMHDGTSYPAVVVGYDADNDVAVIKIDAENLSVVTIGDNNDMQVGDTIYTVGNPLGELDYTMTSGIVSALDRVIQVDSATSINMFQIDAAVNSGNSGGPVYNSKGEVIGIVSAKYASTGVEGLGFAIPINDAVDIVSELITNGYVSGKPSMGISVRDWNGANAQYYGTPEGALVMEVQTGSAADLAGVKVGDIITKLGDYDVTSTDTLLIAKKKFSAGETTTIVINRDGEELSLSLTFDEEGITSTSSRTMTTDQ